MAMPENLIAIHPGAMPIIDTAISPEGGVDTIPGRGPGRVLAPVSLTGDGIPEKEKQIALARLDLVNAWQSFREAAKGGNPLAVIDDEFAVGYQSGVYKSIRDILGEVSMKTIDRWKRELNGTKDWKRLVRNYGAAKAERLAVAEQQIFMGFLLTPNKMPIGTATKFTRIILQRKGFEEIKSDMTYRRFAEDFKAAHYDTWVLMRHGQKALKDKVEPYIKRDPSVLEVGDALVADGHRLNFQVINPFTGKPCRATIVAYVDWKSFDLAGYEIMVEENTQCIASALRNSLIALGKINRVAYQDNGKAFKGKFFTGSPDFRECGISGLFGRLGIVPVYAAPYNARAKIIERWFKEFSNTFERLLPSYIGSSISDKPAYMMRNEKFHKAIHNEYVPTIEETCQLIAMWLQFHRGQECPHVKGKSIGAVFDEGKGTGVDINELDDLMMDWQIKDIRRNGIRFLGQDYYDDNLYGLREEVAIRYSLFDLSEVKVYTRKGEFLCVAKRVMAVHPLARQLGTLQDMEALKRAISLQRRAERKTVQGAKELIGLGKAAEMDWQKVIEAAPGIAEKLEQSDITLPAIEERIPEECVVSSSVIPAQAGIREAGKMDRPIESDDDDIIQSADTTLAKVSDIPRLEPQTLPFFETPIERYEWHLQHGVINEEHRAWCAWFQTTDDFKMLYTYFENQGREEVKNYAEGSM